MLRSQQAPSPSLFPRRRSCATKHSTEGHCWEETQTFTYTFQLICVRQLHLFSCFITRPHSKMLSPSPFPNIHENPMLLILIQLFHILQKREKEVPQCTRNNFHALRGVIWYRVQNINCNLLVSYVLLSTGTQTSSAYHSRREYKWTDLCGTPFTFYYSLPLHWEVRALTKCHSIYETPALQSQRVMWSQVRIRYEPRGTIGTISSYTSSIYN